jgi:hypothetical protein
MKGRSFIENDETRGGYFGWVVVIVSLMEHLISCFCSIEILTGI